MSVDISKIRVGDRITVRMTVQEVDLSDSARPVRASYRVDSLSTWIRPEDIATHEPAPRPIARGDRVRSTFSGQIAIVKAVDEKDQQVWLQWPDGHYGTLPLSVLELLEEGA